jgi:hypothetical protein
MAMNPTRTAAAVCLSITLSLIQPVHGRETSDKETKTTATPTPATYPAALFKARPDLDRFHDPKYFNMVASDGLLTADSKALFERIAAATRSGEGYKALYLSRLFTDAQPNNRTGWSNRARLAASLGFVKEAAAAQANAEAESAEPIVGTALPGTFKVRPTTLSDWAAALALAADDTTAREGRPIVMAVRDDLSGVNVPSAEEVERRNRGPWVNAKPIQVDHVLPNLFAMPEAKPMDRKSINGGMFALGMLATVSSSYATHIGAADSALTFSELSGNAMAKAFEVPSEFKGGAFVAVTYPGGLEKRTDMQPKTAGKHEAIGTPLPILWASGPALSSTVPAVWRNGDSSKSFAMKVETKTKKLEWKNQVVPALYYPRLMQLCGDRNQCTPYTTLLEVLLSADDLRALAPGTEWDLPNVAFASSRYAAQQSLTVASAAEGFVGFDLAGVVFQTTQGPTEWLTTAVPVQNKQNKK